MSNHLPLLTSTSCAAAMERDYNLPRFIWKKKRLIHLSPVLITDY